MGSYSVRRELNGNGGEKKKKVTLAGIFLATTKGIVWGAKKELSAKKKNGI